MSAAEMTLILHPADAKPGADEIQKLIGAVARDSGLNLAGTRLLPLSFSFTPEKGHALAIVDALVDQGRVSPGSVERTVTYNFTVNGAWRLVAVIRANAGNN